MILIAVVQRMSLGMDSKELTAEKNRSQDENTCCLWDMSPLKVNCDAERSLTDH